MKDRSNIKPPRLAVRTFEWFCGHAMIEDLLGDLDETFLLEASTGSVFRAKFLYWKRIISLMLSYSIMKRKRLALMKHNPYGQNPSWSTLSFHNFIVAIRNFKKNGAHSLINVTGLSIGLATCMLLLLYAKDETSFDGFHEKGKRIYQLTVDRGDEDKNVKKFSIAGMIQGPAFKREIPEIDQFVRVRPQQLTIKQNDDVFNETLTWVDPNFFSVFTFPLEEGDAKTTLSEIHNVVLTKSTALKYFNSTDVIGKTLDIQINGTFESFVVSGVAKDCPENSTIRFRMLLPFQYLDEINPDHGWHWVSFATYFLLHDGVDVKTVPGKMKKVYQTQAKQEIDEMQLMGYPDKFKWNVQPFASMHLNTSFEGTPEASDPIYTKILSGLAIFILLIACINFVNLSIAQSIKRTKEIGIRKAIGSQRAQLIFQFLQEAFTICAVSFALAIVLAAIVLPSFNELAHKNLSLSYLVDKRLIIGAVLLFFVTVLTAGGYPALVVSGYDPIVALKGKASLSGKNYLSRSLVVLQFALSSFLVVVTFFMHAQFDLLTKTDLGYDDKHVIEVVVSKAVMNKSLSRVLKSELSKVHNVEVVAVRNIGKFGGLTKANEKEVIGVYEHIDEDYIDAFKIPMVAGRDFSRDFPGDSLHAVLVNESFVKSVGWSDPVGKTIDFMNLPGWGDNKLTVVGVVKDYHFESFKERIKPEVFTYEPKLPLGKFEIRVNPANTSQTLQELERAFHKVLPFDPFSYEFVEDINRRNYESEDRWKKIMTTAAALTISISCFGLLALSSLSTEQRSKEIGIRRVLGSSTKQIVAMITKDFMILTVIGFVLAVPVAWVVVQKWLEGFAYRVDLDIRIFIAAGVASMLVALTTIVIQIYRSSLTNPLKVLKGDS